MQTDKEKRLAYAREYYRTHKAQMYAAQKKYRASHLEKCREIQRKYWNRKHKKAEKLEIPQNEK